MKKRFSKSEFTTLFANAIQSCHEFAEERCAEIFPQKRLFYLSNFDGKRSFDNDAQIKYVSKNWIKTFDQTIPYLLNEDGFFQAWINISPEGLTETEIVFAISIPNRWTDILIDGELAFKFEPFHILGPDYPWDWKIGMPDPILKLALIKYLSE